MVDKIFHLVNVNSHRWFSIRAAIGLRTPVGLYSDNRVPSVFIVRFTQLSERLHWTAVAAISFSYQIFERFISKFDSYYLYIQSHRDSNMVAFRLFITQYEYWLAGK